MRRGPLRRLALRLAQAALQLRQRVRGQLQRRPLAAQFAAFRSELSDRATQDEFADTLAQTIAYRALALRLGLLPAGFEPLPSFLVPCLTPAEADLAFVHDAIDASEIAPALAEFHEDSPGESPLLRFYEIFLDAYDPAARKRRGVFFTPRPLAAHLVRAADRYLQSELGLAEGLADTITWGELAARHPGLALPEGVEPMRPFVRVLDPAAGTGAFLVAAIELIHARLTAAWRAEGQSQAACARRWQRWVQQQLLTRLHGYELLPAAYAIGHMALVLVLRATGYRLRPGERVGLYLTNGLDAAAGAAREAQRALRFKESGVPTVFVGNPPYAALSANLTPTCRAAVDAYRRVAGHPIRERGMLQLEKNLQDDYVKFLARAEQGIARAGAGVVAFVCNHSFLDGPTLRGLRHSLAHSFERIDVVDLHGAINKRERPPGGGRDENIFAIRQGVALVLLRRGFDVNGAPARVRRSDLWGARAAKLADLDRAEVHEVELREPDFLFVAGAADRDPLWDNAWPLTSVFAKYSTGTESGFDALLLDFERPALLRKLRHFASASTCDSELRRAYDITRGHAARLLGQRADLCIREQRCRPLQFRPFDFRHAYLDKPLLKTNSFNVMMELSAAAPGLVATRQTKERFGVFVTAGFCGHKCTSAYDRSYVFPLASGFRVPFIGAVEAALGVRPSDHELFHYAYALLSAPSYGERFGARLTREFARLPVPVQRPLFARLAGLGRELAALHLRSEPPPGAAPMLMGPAPKRVAAGFPKYQAGRVHIDGQHWFDGVAEPVWRHQIGAYQVCAAWLKERRGRSLSREDIERYQHIILILRATLPLIEACDVAIERHGGWPGAFVIHAANV